MGLKLEPLKELDWRAYRVVSDTEILYLWADYGVIAAWPTLEALYAARLKAARTDYSNYSRRCPGRDTAEENIAKYTQLVKAATEKQ